MAGLAAVLADCMADHLAGSAGVDVIIGVDLFMSTTRRVQSSREKAQAHRTRLRRRGLRLIQLWVPDVRSKAFAREARRQALLVAQSPQAADDQAFVDTISAWNDE